MRSTIIVIALLFARATSAEPPTSADEDIGIGWKLGIGCAIATIALSGVVGAVTRQPIETSLRRANPQLANALSPTVVIGGTAALGFVAGLTFATAAVTSAVAPSPGDR